MNAPFFPPASHTVRELVIDSFAGGGGASEGIKAALGCDPDIAVNHDLLALAMHRVNHPGTRHMVEDVVAVDSVGMCAGRPIGLLWMSPDCTDHSKAKGAAPRRGENNTRGLAWAIVGWVKKLPMWQRPRVIILENVEEFKDWGPLLENGKRCPVQKGAIFNQFVEALRALGYKDIEWRERRAWRAGAATIRKRLYLIARRDGEPIVWPEPTHGNPNDPADAARIAAGELKPWRTAADIIDFSLPCPSIFETSEEIKRKHGLRAIRPLADKTMARVAKGTMRYVVNSAKPFLIRTAHGDVDRTGKRRGQSDQSIDQPVPTVTGSNDAALVMPYVTYAQQGGASRPADAPMHTVTASAKDQNAVVAPVLAPFMAPRLQEKPGDEPRGRSVELPMATIAASDSLPGHLIAPVLAGCGGRAGQSEPRPGDTPILTQTGKADLCYVAPVLVPRYGERDGQAPRALPADEPMPTVVPTGNGAGLAAVHLQRQFGASVGSAAAAPVGTITAGGDGKTAVVAAHLMTMRNADKPFQAADRPAHTITAGGAHPAMVAAFLAQHNGGPRPGAPGHPADEPVSTIATAGAQQQLVAAHMLNMRGSERRGAGADEPLRTDTAGGNHAAAVYAFLAKYFGTGLPSQPADEPLHTITGKPRHGLVYVTVAGEPYVIVDIGMRMLTPRERFNAQGFRPDYIIDHGTLEDGREVKFSLADQGRMCGNSVCPDEAAALVSANYQPREVAVPHRRRAGDAQSSMFLEAAE